jgi:hypothetical protein
LRARLLAPRFWLRLCCSVAQAIVFCRLRVLTRISHQSAGQLVSVGVPTRYAGERALRWIPDRPSEPKVA